MHGRNSKGPNLHENSDFFTLFFLLYPRLWLGYACVIFLPEVLGLASSSILGGIGCGVPAVGTTRREQKCLCLETLHIPECLECYSSSSAPITNYASPQRITSNKKSNNLCT